MASPLKPEKYERWSGKSIAQIKNKAKKLAVVEELEAIRRQQGDLKAEFYARTAKRWGVGQDDSRK